MQDVSSSEARQSAETVLTSIQKARRSFERKPSARDFADKTQRIVEYLDRPAIASLTDEAAVFLDQDLKDKDRKFLKTIGVSTRGELTSPSVLSKLGRAVHNKLARDAFNLAVQEGPMQEASAEVIEAKKWIEQASRIYAKHRQDLKVGSVHPERVANRLFYAALHTFSDDDKSLLVSMLNDKQNQMLINLGFFDGQASSGLNIVGANFDKAVLKRYEDLLPSDTSNETEQRCQP